MAEWQDRRLRQKEVAPIASRAPPSKRATFKPGSYLNQSIEVISSGFRAGKLDGAVLWEPVTSRLVSRRFGAPRGERVTISTSPTALSSMCGPTSSNSVPMS